MSSGLLISGMTSDPPIRRQVTRRVNSLDEIFQKLRTPSRAVIASASPETYQRLSAKGSNFESNGYVLKVVFFHIGTVGVKQKKNREKYGIELTHLSGLNGSEKKELNRQNEALSKVVNALNNGLNIHEGINALDIKENVFLQDPQTNEQYYLVSLHPHTSSRIAGFYNPRNKTVYFCFYFSNHGAWDTFINSLELISKRQSRSRDN